MTVVFSIKKGNKVRLLITGATGTIGKALIPHVLKGLWTDVILFSRDELKQSELERSLRGEDGFWKLQFWLGDIRDKDRIEEATRGTTHIIHAAALKRIEKCERDPAEAYKTNVIGTDNIIKAALKNKVSSVCIVSTDKAHRPKSVYGATKLLAERLALAAFNKNITKFSIVRQGNIFNSRGSVADVWKTLMAKGYTSVPITAPEATRYFVTADEAAKFIVKVLTTRTGLVYPEDLRAYMICDLAKALGVDTHTVGLSSIEKLDEELNDQLTSSMAPLLTVEELKRELKRELNATVLS